MTVYNERVKLLATALNGVAIASIALGVIAPLVAAVYGFGEAASVAHRTLAVGVVIWLFVAVVIQLGAQLVLGGLDVEPV